MLILTLLVIAIIFISGIATFIMMGSLALNWISTIPSAPEFLNTGNVLGWITMLIAFIILAYLIHFICHFSINALFKLLKNNIEDKERLTVISFVAGASLYAILIIGTICGVHYLFETLTQEQYLDYATMYDKENGLSKFFHFIFFTGIILPLRKTSDRN